MKNESNHDENHPKNGYSRRDFLRASAVSCLAFALPGTASAALRPIKSPIKIGLITDLHQDIMHDGLQRTQAFVDEVKKQRPHAIVQLGDFAYPGDKNKDVIDLFNNAHETSLHVIGNHDTDAGYTTDQCISYWGMPARYYTQEIEGIHFIFLDGNEKGSPSYKGGYPAYVGEAQRQWLEQQLAAIEGPIVVVSHQPLAGPSAVDNAGQMQDILASAADKILFAINGHTHIDTLLEKKGISYLHLNSASYLWVGGDYKHQSYSAEIHKKHPTIASTCPYRDSLFSFLTIDPKTLSVRIEGKRSEWVGSSPVELGVKSHPTLTFGEEVAPRITGRHIRKS